MESMERDTITKEGLSPRGGLSENIVVEKERLPRNRQKSNADLFMCRILCIPEEHSNVTEEQAHKIFSLSIAISGLRCLLSYVILPVLLPLAGLATGMGPAIGIPVGIVALIFDVKGIRRFWLSSHPWRWPISIIYLFIIVMVIGLIMVSIIHLAA
ncbi:MAG: hypothetical protein M1399_00010 [Actinobacteria bacterium]|nr:hypothetical protein [Actinomycetota bacterium]MCL5446482.1 hypothetical protein [Actinomycetota bacterium]